MVTQMMADHGAICLVEHGGDIFLIRAVLYDGQRTGFYEFATSTGSGQPVEWRDASEGDGFAGLVPLVARYAPLNILDQDSHPRVPPDLLETRAEFARRLNIDDGRVHQWVKSGQIGKDALHGRGSYARIKVQLALSQLSERRGRGWRKRRHQLAGSGINASPAALAVSISSALAARKDSEAPTKHLELPPGFIEAAAALWTGMQHEDPAGFLTTALQLHRAARGAQQASPEGSGDGIMIDTPSILDSAEWERRPHGLIESKSAFARRLDVDPSTVSHWLQRRQIDEHALVGVGEYAKISVEIALGQLRERRGRGWRRRRPG